MAGTPCRLQMHSALGSISAKLSAWNGDPERLLGIENGRVKDDPQLPGLGPLFRADGSFPRLIPNLFPFVPFLADGKWVGHFAAQLGTLEYLGDWDTGDK